MITVRSVLTEEDIYAVVRDDDPDSLGYYTARGYALGRMQDVQLDLASVVLEPTLPDGITLVPASPEHVRGADQVVLEADADIPSGEPIRTGEFDAWHARHLRRFRQAKPVVRRAGGQTCGYEWVQLGGPLLA